MSSPQTHPHSLKLKQINDIISNVLLHADPTHDFCLPDEWDSQAGEPGSEFYSFELTTCLSDKDWKNTWDCLKAILEPHGITLSDGKNDSDSFENSYAHVDIAALEKLDLKSFERDLTLKKKLLIAAANKDFAQMLREDLGDFFKDTPPERIGAILSLLIDGMPLTGGDAAKARVKKSVANHSPRTL